MLILGNLPMGKARAYELQQRPWYKPLKKHVVIEYVEEY